MSRAFRVLIADDSAFVRKVIRAILAGHADLEVVGIARDGLDALEKCHELQPDVMTLDLVMPHLDGLGVLDSLPKSYAPRVVVVSTSEADSVAGVTALQRGAFDVVHKPTGLATEDLFEVAGELLLKVRAAGAAAPRSAPSRDGAPAMRVPQPGATSLFDVVVIGASTGGPSALTRFLPMLPGDLPVALAIALHIPAGYTRALSERLNNAAAISVAEAVEGHIIERGSAVLATGGAHLILSRDGENVVAHIQSEPRMTLCPSVDLLFESAARCFGARALGVVLTGMGDDGLRGARALLEAGGKVITESEASCVVYGMPRCVYEAGLAMCQAPLEAMAYTLMQQL